MSLTLHKDVIFQIDCLSETLVGMLMEELGYDLLQALDTLYLSETYRLICDPETGLYYESPIYVFSYLLNEIKHGTVA